MMKYGATFYRHYEDILYLPTMAVSVTPLSMFCCSKVSNCEGGNVQSSSPGSPDTGTSCLTLLGLGAETHRGVNVALLYKSMIVIKKSIFIFKNKRALGHSSE